MACLGARAGEREPRSSESAASESGESLEKATRAAAVVFPLSTRWRRRTHMKMPRCSVGMQARSKGKDPAVDGEPPKKSIASHRAATSLPTSKNAPPWSRAWRGRTACERIWPCPSPRRHLGLNAAYRHTNGVPPDHLSPRCIRVASQGYG